MSESDSRGFSAVSYRYVSEFDYDLSLQIGTFAPHTERLISKWFANDNNNNNNNLFSFSITIQAR